jgi:hypothetical protein
MTVVATRRSKQAARPLTALANQESNDSGKRIDGLKRLHDGKEQGAWMLAMDAGRDSARIAARWPWCEHPFSGQ